MLVLKKSFLKNQAFEIAGLRRLAVLARVNTKKTNAHAIKILCSIVNVRFIKSAF